MPEITPTAPDPSVTAALRNVAATLLLATFVPATGMPDHEAETAAHVPAGDPRVATSRFPAADDLLHQLHRKLRKRRRESFRVRFRRAAWSDFNS